MTDTNPFEPKKSPAEAAIERALKSALIYEDRMRLPELSESAECTTNAELHAVYTPWYKDLHVYLMNAVLAHVLIRIGETSPRLANEIAYEVDEWLEAGDAYPEWIWEWATDRNMSPDKIRTDARTEHAEWLTQTPKPRPTFQAPTTTTTPALAEDQTGSNS